MLVLHGGDRPDREAEPSSRVAERLVRANCPAASGVTARDERAPGPSWSPPPECGPGTALRCTVPLHIWRLTGV